MLYDPALADKQGHALWIGTPKGKGNHFYDLYEWAGAQDDWQTFRFTSLEGGFDTLKKLNLQNKKWTKEHLDKNF